MKILLISLEFDVISKITLGNSVLVDRKLFNNDTILYF